MVAAVVTNDPGAEVGDDLVQAIHAAVDYASGVAALDQREKFLSSFFTVGTPLFLFSRRA